MSQKFTQNKQTQQPAPETPVTENTEATEQPKDETVVGETTPTPEPIEATEQSAPTEVPAPTPEPVVAPVVDAPAATVIPVTVNSVLEAPVANGGVSGGIAPRAATLRDALLRYKEAVSPAITVDPVEGGRAQYSFYMATMNAIKDPDPVSFMSCMEVLVAFVKENSGNREVCNPRYANRFAAHFAGGHDQRKAWEFLWVVLHAVAASDAKRQLSEINWEHAFQLVPDEYRVRLRQYFGERYGH